MLKNPFAPQPAAVEDDNILIGVIIAGPPNIAQPFLRLSPGNSSGVHILTTTRDAADLPSDIQEFQPKIVLVSPDLRGYTPDLISQLANWPDFPLAVAGIVPNSGNWGSEMATNGAVAFYNAPVTPAIVEQFAQQARGLVEQAGARWSAPVVASGVSSTVVNAVRATAYRTGAIVFWSTKGGDGKTTVTVNVACLLSLIAGKKVLLIDADMNGGRVMLHLNIAPEETKTLLHLASDYRSNGNRLDAQMLKRRITAADKSLDPRTKSVESRLDVLFGLTDIEQASSPDLSAEQGVAFMTDLVRLGRELYDFVLIDLGSNTQIGPHFGALKEADQVMFICTSDRTSIYLNQKTVAALTDPEKSGLRADKFKLVVNRYDPADLLKLEGIASYVGMTIFATVPEDKTRAVIASVNKGKPFVLEHMGKNDPEAEATLRGLMEICEGIFPPFGQIIEARSEKSTKKGLLSRIGAGR
jgi:MinD-like ATPase involved in chromosome partitioning or flagellar assembly